MGEHCKVVLFTQPASRRLYGFKEGVEKIEVRVLPLEEKEDLLIEKEQQK